MAYSSINNNLSDPIKQNVEDKPVGLTGTKDVPSKDTSGLDLSKSPNALDTSVQEFISKIDEVQLGKLLASLKEHDIFELDKKALIAYLVSSAQSKKKIFPYNRYLKDGSKPFSIIVSPNDKTEKECIVWCNNHYLGLNRHPKVLEFAHETLDHYGTGGGTSAVSGGFSSVHKNLEEDLAKLLNKPEAILYPTGFTTNLGGISSLAHKGDLLIVDKESHASIIDGVRMSDTDFKIFRHNDPNHLEHILNIIDRNKYKNIIVLTESVFSMSGEEAPLNDYCALRKKYGFFLFVDEAHAFGFYGEKGAGLAEQMHCSSDIDFIMTTLSKATASIGGVIAADRQYCTFLRVQSNPYLFQACMTPVDAAVSLASLKIIQSEKKHREKLWANTNKFRSLIKGKGFNVGNSTSPIVPIYVPDEKKLAKFCRELFENGIFTNWVSYPAVPKKLGRLRFIVNATHTDELIDRTVTIVEKLGKKLGVI